MFTKTVFTPTWFTQLRIRSRSWRPTWGLWEGSWVSQVDLMSPLGGVLGLPMTAWEIQPQAPIVFSVHCAAQDHPGRTHEIAHPRKHGSRFGIVGTLLAALTTRGRKYEWKWHQNESKMVPLKTQIYMVK